jgi:hypothetical protein
MLRLSYLMADCWPEVSLHPEGPATGQLDHGFSLVFLGPRANAELVPKFGDMDEGALHRGIKVIVKQRN